MRNLSNTRSFVMVGLLLLLLTCFVAPLTEAFTPPATPRSRCSSSLHQQSIRVASSIYSSKDDNDNSQNDFFEQAAQEGAERVKAMSVEERTKRAMLAEAVEDRIVVLYDDLELLLGEDGLPSTVENRAEVEVLAREIKSLRQEYQVLVNGGHY